jgi:hypothetical protein
LNVRFAESNPTIFQSAQGSEPIDIVLATESSNTDFAKMLSQAKTEGIENSADYEIFRTGDSASGAIALFSKPDQTIDYLVQHELADDPLLEQPAIRVKLWRKTGSTYVQRFTRKIVFDYLLREFRCLLSDPNQTTESTRFWVSRMAEAITLGYRAALVKLDAREVNWFDPSQGSFLNWVRANQACALLGTKESHALPGPGGNADQTSGNPIFVTPDRLQYLISN